VPKIYDYPGARRTQGQINKNAQYFLAIQKTLKMLSKIPRNILQYARYDTKYLHM